MQTNAKRYPDEVLRHFETLIQDNLKAVKKEADSIKSRLDGLENQATENGGHSYGEDSKNHEQRELLTRMYERQAEKIHDLELALGRIANKTYGICQETGELIGKKRLEAFPAAVTSAKVLG
jgi:DnaK suppressor protein